MEYSTSRPRLPAYVWLFALRRNGGQSPSTLQRTSDSHYTKGTHDANAERTRTRTVPVPNYSPFARADWAGIVDIHAEAHGEERKACQRHIVECAHKRRKCRRGTPCATSKSPHAEQSRAEQRRRFTLALYCTVRVLGRVPSDWTPAQVGRWGAGGGVAAWQSRRTCARRRGSRRRTASCGSTE